MENFSVSTQNKGKLNYGPLLIAFAATTWTMDFFSRKIVLNVMDPTVLVMIEHIIITLFLVPFLWKSRSLVTQFNAKEWIALIIIGAGASALAAVALSTGYKLGFFQYAPVVALTQQFQPVIAIGLAHLMLKETLPKYYYPLSITAIIGVFLMYYPTVSGIHSDLLNDLGFQAAFWGLLAAILWGSGTVFGNYMLVHADNKLDYREMASFRFAIGMLALIIFNIMISAKIPFSAINGTIAFNILFIALIPGLLGLVVYYYGLKSTHASVATLFELAYPLSFFIFVPLLSKDTPITPIQYVGAIILIISTTILSYIYGKATSPDQFEHIQENEELRKAEEELIASKAD